MSSLLVIKLKVGGRSAYAVTSAGCSRYKAGRRVPWDDAVRFHSALPMVAVPTVGRDVSMFGGVGKCPRTSLIIASVFRVQLGADRRRPDLVVPLLDAL